MSAPFFLLLILVAGCVTPAPASGVGEEGGGAHTELVLGGIAGLVKDLLTEHGLNADAGPTTSRRMQQDLGAALGLPKVGMHE